MSSVLTCRDDFVNDTRIIDFVAAIDEECQELIDKIEKSSTCKIFKSLDFYNNNLTFFQSYKLTFVSHYILFQ